MLKIVWLIFGNICQSITKFIILANSSQMESSSKDKKNIAASSKDKAYQRRSLNSASKSKNKHQDPLIGRGHASEVLHAQVTKIDSAKKSENVIASLQKHRDAKSSQKNCPDNREPTKIDDAPNKSLAKVKNKSEVETIRQGQKWVSLTDTTHQIISLAQDENQNLDQNSKNDKSKRKARNQSKKKAEGKKPQAQSKSKGSKSKAVDKSAAKSKTKKSAKKKNIQASELKRNKMNDNDLTNEPQEEVQEVKNRKKSNLKSGRKE